MTPFDFAPRTRVLFGEGGFHRLGEVARELGGARCLLVADPGMVEAGYAQEAARSLKARRILVHTFHDFHSDPTSAHVEAGYAAAQPHSVDLIVAVGGGSSLDCAKGINFLLSNGGTIRDYWGYGKASRPMLPMIAVPTTAGTGSEAQSYATITDSETGTRMACGDRKASFRVAILDPKLTVTQPAALAASAGYDALSHALETFVTTRCTELSACFSRSAWRLTNSGLEGIAADPSDLEARGQLLIGAHFGGLAIENSALGAAHACAYALSSNFRLPHGVSIAVMLPHVVAWNWPAAGKRYEELYAGDLAAHLVDLAQRSGLPTSLKEAGVPQEAIPRLADDAASQWIGKFNPRPLDVAGAREIFERAA